MALLEVRGVEAYYGNIKALDGITISRRARRDRHPDRLERRRQVDHPQDDLGPAPSASR